MLPAKDALTLSPFGLIKQKNIQLPALMRGDFVVFVGCLFSMCLLLTFCLLIAEFPSFWGLRFPGAPPTPCFVASSNVYPLTAYPSCLLVAENPARLLFGV